MFLTTSILRMPEKFGTMPSGYVYGNRDARRRRQSDWQRPSREKMTGSGPLQGLPMSGRGRTPRQPCNTLRPRILSVRIHASGLPRWLSGLQLAKR